MGEPDVPTKYFVTLTDPYGCSGTDSVFVDVKSFVSLQAGNDTTICGGDPVRLNLRTDGLYFAWTESPSGSSLDFPGIRSPLASPLATTTYKVSASIGKCVATDDITLRAVPYPIPHAGPIRLFAWANHSTQCNGWQQLHLDAGNFFK
jgi:hypothetical protein